MARPRSQEPQPKLRYHVHELCSPNRAPFRLEPKHVPGDTMRELIFQQFSMQYKQLHNVDGIVLKQTIRPSTKRHNSSYLCLIPAWRLGVCHGGERMGSRDSIHIHSEILSEILSEIIATDQPLAAKPLCIAFSALTSPSLTLQTSSQTVLRNSWLWLTSTTAPRKLRRARPRLSTCKDTDLASHVPLSRSQGSWLARQDTTPRQLFKNSSKLFKTLQNLRETKE